MSKDLSIYDLMKSWFDFCFENPEKINPSHSALYFFALSHCNRLGWKSKFGLPTTMTMEAIGIKSYNTYIKTFNELSVFGFIKIIEKSKNQYSSNIIALSKFDKALDKALDKATIKHLTKQGESTQQSNDSIIIPIHYDTNLPIHESTILLEKETKQKFSFKSDFLSLGVEIEILDDWLEVRKKKKATNSKTAFDGIKSQIDLSGLTANECIKISAVNSWAGFKTEWLKTIENGITKIGTQQSIPGTQNPNRKLNINEQMQARRTNFQRRVDESLKNDQE